MFKFLKKIFKEEVIKEDIKLEELENWFNQKTESYFSSFKEYVKENINEFNSLLNQLNEKIQELEKAEIENPDKIEDRVKSIVQGHRINYIRRVNLFQRNISLPQTHDYDAIIEFLDYLEKELDALNKDTIKSFQATQHLFHKPVEEAAKIIGKISELRDKFMKNIQEKNLTKILDAKKQIKNLFNQIKKQEDLTIQLGEEKNKLQEIENLKQSNQNKLEQLKNSSEYLELRDLKAKLIDNENDINEIKNNILNLFSPLESGFRKYERISLDNIGLIRSYLDDPVIALLGDKELKILIVLEKFKQSIEKGSLDLKDKKKDSVLKAIDKITKENLEKIFLHYDELNNRKQEIEKKISANTSLEKEKDLQYKVEHFDNSLKRNNKAIDEINHNLERIDIDKEKENIKNSIKEILRIEVNI